MCALARGWGAGDVGDVEGATWHHDLRCIAWTWAWATWAPRTGISARRRRLDVFPSVYSFHPYPAPVTHMLCADSSQPSGRVQQPSVVFPTLPLPVLVTLPMCSPCMFTMSCPARARMPGIVLCLACLLMLGLPCLLPLPLPCSLCHALATRDFYFLVISFLFVSPFCGSTKRIGPFVLPQKGRTVPSLFLFFFSLSADFRSIVLRPPPGAISVDRASSGFSI